ncbi:replication initiator protein A [Deinococcus hopiensis]|uniref:Plasmid replication initiator protein n=1 Tax=Deinococcus hopiensis KR-140 TaxID=695939 RepID=A0A1W1UCI0_9DEIO|nr:replication initiator protein A [Deinococcus hopiensis]SMB78521.1 Plasmid replication initiator protein [Deinococcus hopiensis KR-140]
MPKKPKNPNLHDELNFARFGVISMHSRVDQRVPSWRTEFTVNDRTFRIEAITPQGRPHGIDTDTLVALETLFVANGCPGDNWIHTTAYEVRELMGLANNGENYHRLRQSIRRLYFTSVIVGRKSTIAGAHKTAWDNVGVRFFEGLRYRDNEDDGELSTLDSEATLSIRLGEQLADSLRAGISQVLDGHLLHQLEQPPARALYRTLQAHRRQDDGTLLKELHVPLREWRHATGLTTDRSDLVRRALEAAHDELLANQYLEGAVIEGRGKNAVARYTFADVNAPDPALVVLLRQAGVTVARATVLAARHGDRVEEALRFVEFRKGVAGGAVRNPGGLVADFLENPAKYELPAEFTQVEERRQASRAQSEQWKLRAEQEAQAQAQAYAERLESASTSQQWEAQRATLQLMLKKHLNAQQWSQLEDLAQRGEISALELSRTLVGAAAGASLPEEIDRLKRRLNPLLPLE